jgi:HlyD family secretion protein
VLAAQELIDSVNLTAPFDGTVTALNIQPGDLVSPGTAAMQVDDLSNRYVDLQVSEVDIDKVQNGQAAQLTFDAIPDQTYDGKVVQVGQVGTTSSGVVNYIVTVQITDADQQVKAGMTAAANITTSALTNALLVPSRAIRVVGTQHDVYVPRSQQIVPVQVQVGLTPDTMSQIVSGNVQAGDQVLVNPSTLSTTAATNRGFGGGLFGGLFGGARVAGGGGFGGGNFGGGGQRPAGGSGGTGGG